MSAPLAAEPAMVWVIAGVKVLLILVVGGVLATVGVDMLWPLGEPEAAQPEAGEQQAAEPDEAGEQEAAEPDGADGPFAEIASPGPAEEHDGHCAQRAPPREPVHITTVDDVRAWGERMRAEISAWAQPDPSPSPPGPAEGGADPPATARSPRKAR